MLRHLRGQPLLVLGLWTALVVALVFALVEQRWSLAFVAAATFGLSLLPFAFARRFGVTLPASFAAAIVAFIFATIFLGEAFDFYNRYWWWDIALHSGSALGFGLMGFLLVFMLFEGDRYAAPPWAVAFFAFCFAVTVGAVWEIFEYAMDQNFGLSMQKSGLDDTMGDIIVNMVGAATGASVGFFYLKGYLLAGLSRPIADFIRSNRRLFRKLRK